MLGGLLRIAISKRTSNSSDQVGSSEKSGSLVTGGRMCTSGRDWLAGGGQMVKVRAPHRDGW